MLHDPNDHLLSSVNGKSPWPPLVYQNNGFYLHRWPGVWQDMKGQTWLLAESYLLSSRLCTKVLMKKKPHRFPQKYSSCLCLLMVQCLQYLHTSNIVSGCNIVRFNSLCTQKRAWKKQERPWKEVALNTSSKNLVINFDRVQTFLGIKICDQISRSFIFPFKNLSSLSNVAMAALALTSWSPWS